MTILYNIFFIVFGIIYLPFFLARLRQAESPRKLVGDRCGLLSPSLIQSVGGPVDKTLGKSINGAGKKVIWVHAVSVGEVMAAGVFIKKLKERFPSHISLVSTVTPTGQKLAKSLCGPDRVFYFPFDLSFIVRRVLAKLNPEIIILIETEIWPNLIEEASSCGIPVGIINGRLSPRSSRQYERFRFLITPILNKISFILAQTEEDRERYIRLGYDFGSIRVTGNMKFDASLGRDSSGAPEVLKKSLGFPDTAPIFIAGSTHPGEEKIVLDVFGRLRLLFPNLKLVIAPRHIERSRDLKRMAEERSFKVRSAKPLEGDVSSGEFDVFLLNTLGELRQLYSIADLVFMGGSLIRHGGQNPIEPASFKRPVIFGPHVFNFQAIYSRLASANAAKKLLDSDSFYEIARQILSSPERAKIMGDAAFSVVQSLRGATERNLDIISQFLGKGKKDSASRSAAEWSLVK
ncbi:MAG: 3-deoxy-D-manno-octulosonic acid transferase [Candidatus Omnitrophica bacterium]|nr:3-deoxy-D-manno-octulosonic acid transferase [Candidatus Omnitrophota bacterium]